MKQVWRFIKWSFSGMTFRSWTLVLFSFFGAGGLTAGNTQLRTYMWSVCAVIGAYWWLDILVDVVKGQWEKFKEHDERIFNILKKEKIDG